MGITWASPTKRGGRLDDCRSASPTASVAKCAVSEATKERVHANDVHAHIRPWAKTQSQGGSRSLTRGWFGDFQMNVKR